MEMVRSLGHISSFLIHIRFVIHTLKIYQNMYIISRKIYVLKVGSSPMEGGVMRALIVF